MSAYYNEFDPYAAEWLRNLIKAGLIPDGDVDERSIELVQPDELRGYTQCHFFAGIGGWSCALRLAGWPDDRPIWTGSCPCQPFSVAGQGRGTSDSRHLWPHFYRLIRGCKPDVVMGEQVTSPAGLSWLDGVFDDLEAEAYSCRPIDIPACGIGAPHIRQRLYWLADTVLAGRAEGRSGTGSGSSAGSSEFGGLGNPHLSGSQGRGEQAGQYSDQRVAESSGQFGGVADTYGRESRNGDIQRSGQHGFVSTDSRVGFWSSYDMLHCLDGKARRIEPGTFPLAHGVPGRVGQLRAYGNAIVPPLAAEVIKAYMKSLDTHSECVL